MRLRPLMATLALLASAPAVAAERVPMAAHRALYNLSLETIRGGDIGAATGSMAYEVTDSCDGWASRQRLSMTLTNRDGQDIQLVSDYATWESKDGLQMRFRMRQTTDTAVTEQVEGTATLDPAGAGGSVHYTIPEEKDVTLPAGTLFPMRHTETLIAGAQDGKKFLNVPIFDGTGDHGAQDSFVVMNTWGSSAAAPFPALAGMESGKVHVSFFDRAAKPSPNKLAGLPDYEVGMTYFGNGVADDLHMDFTDFVMRGHLAEFTLSPPHC